MSSPPRPFSSPLLLEVRTELTALGFGRVEAPPVIERLRQDLNQCLLLITEELPAPLAAEARAVVHAYSGGDGDFFRLFYVPIWSFLHWVPAASGCAPALGFAREARTAHALSLFLHLWDDHLCDRQLEVDLLRLQLRTVAWQHFRAAARSLGRRVGAGDGWVDEHCADYLVSLHRPEPVADLDGYCRRFIRQVGIWTLVPRLLGDGVAGPGAGNDLRRVVASFAVAWRLLDDLQDAHLDLDNAEPTAVRLVLDAQGRKLWQACRTRTQALGRLAAAEWQDLTSAIRASGALGRLLARIRAELTAGARVASARGWHGIARELEQSRGLEGTAARGSTGDS